MSLVLDVLLCLLALESLFLLPVSVLLLRRAVGNVRAVEGEGRSPLGMESVYGSFDPEDDFSKYGSQFVGVSDGVDFS